MEKCKCKDHLENVYASVSEMCRSYGITRAAYNNRIKKSWSLKTTLTTPVRNPQKETHDHLGNVYKSITEMCRAYGITVIAYNGRIENGWSLKDALTKPVRHKQSKLK